MLTKTASRLTVLLVLVAASIFPAHSNWYGKRGDKDDLYNAILQAQQTQNRQQLADALAAADLDLDTSLDTIDNILRMDRQQQESKFSELKRA